MKVTQSYNSNSTAPLIGPGGGGGYVYSPVTQLVAASSDANPSIYKANNNDSTIEADASSQNVQVTLTAATQSQGRKVIVKRIDATYAAANTVSIVDAAGANIEGATSLALTAQNAVVELQSDGTQWSVISGGNKAPMSTTAAPVTLTVGASPYAYTAPASGEVIINGGTVSAVTIKRGAASAINVGVVAGPMPVSPGDILTTTYSVAPTMTFLPQ